MEPGRDALELLKQVWMTKGPSHLTLPVDPITIAKKLGIEVFSDEELPPEVTGILRRAARYCDPEIFLNPLDDHRRRRSTCAYVLGHYSRNIELGRDEAWEFVEGRDLFLAGTGDAKASYATEFAAELTIPRVALEEVADVQGIAALAGFFGVPGDVMSFRLDRIG